MVKTAVITGANRGIGLRVAKNLIDKEFQVILACRSEKKGLQAEQYLGPGAKFLPLDLSSKPSIEHFSEIVLKESSNIDVLYNNAGLIYNLYQLTEEGYESMISVNVYGSFRLSLLLLENIERAQGKLLQVTSLASYLARSFSINNLHSKQDFSPSKRYNLTNLLRSMFALELDNKLQSRDISIGLVHPGITKSRQSRPYEVTKIKKSIYTYISTNIQTGADPVLKAIDDKIVNAEKVYAPRLFGIYGRPSLHKHNRLVYKSEYRKQLWSHLVEELELDI